MGVSVTIVDGSRNNIKTSGEAKLISSKLSLVFARKAMIGYSEPSCGKTRIFAKSASTIIALCKIRRGMSALFFSSLALIIISLRTA